jgi:uncharacterized protein (TIGR03000 family)
MHRNLAVIACALVFASVGHAWEFWGRHREEGTIYVPWSRYPLRDWGPLDSDETPGAYPGGLVISRQNGQSVVRVGGGLFPMKVWVTEPGPQGPVTEKLVFPGAAQSSYLPFALQDQVVNGPPWAAGRNLPPAPAVVPPVAPDRAYVQVQIPDPIGVLYLDGKLTDTAGTSRRLESPPLARGQSHVFRLRAGFKAGDNLLIEEKEVVVRAGEAADVTFDGKRATSVPLPK